jgi:hypothetical protein
MFQTGIYNTYFEVSAAVPAAQDNPAVLANIDQGNPSATWTEERLQKSLKFADKENTAIVFCPWTNDLAMLETLDKAIFARRPELALVIDRRWRRPESFDAPDGFFETIGAILPEHIAKMTHVRKLSLDFGKSATIDALGNMGGLISLRLDNNGKIKQSISFLKRLPNLETLTLSGIYSDMDTLGECGKLRDLALTGNQVDYKLAKPEIPAWSIFESLQLSALCLNLAKVSAPLKLGKGLKKLVLANCNIDELSAVEACTSLEELLLHRLPATALDFSRLKKLTALSLERCKSLVAKGLEKVSALEYLQIYDCKMITKKEVVALAKTLPALKKLAGVDFAWDAPLEKAGLNHLIHNPNDNEAHEFLRYADRYNVY